MIHFCESMTLKIKEPSYIDKFRATLRTLDISNMVDKQKGKPTQSVDSTRPSVKNQTKV